MSLVPLRPLLLILLLAGLTAVSAAQEIGGLPSLSWYRFGNDTVRFISAPATLPYALRSDTLVRGLARLRPLALGERLKPIDIFVQPVTVESNGFVGVTPWRSFLYATPPQDQGLVSSNDWADALAIHEYRHVEQYANLLRGWTRAARIVFGNGGWGVATGLSTPDWFFEGDAVYTETALTYAGRGRTPAFTALQRALALDSTRYPYGVSRNGSLRQRVPNHYPLGYALVQHGRIVHGDPWPAVVRGAGTFWPPVYPFSVALKRQTGLHTPAFYREAYDSLGQVWQAAAFAKTRSSHRPLTPLGRHITLYRYPQPDPTAMRGETNADTPRPFLVLRQSRVDLPALVRITAEGREERLAPLGFDLDDGFHAAGGRAVWSRLGLDPRRPDESYSDVYVLDLDGEMGRRSPSARRLSLGQQLFSPALSPDGRRVVAVAVPAGGASLDQRRLPALRELDASTGAVLRERAFEVDLLIGPRYAGAAREEVVVIAKRDGWLSLQVLSFDGAPRQLTPWSRHVLGTPYVHAGHVYFSASYTGVDNVFRVALAGDGQLEQLTEVLVGAYTPSTDGERLYFTEVRPEGDPVSVLAWADWLLRPVRIVEPVDLPQYAGLEPDAAGLAFRQNFLSAPPPSGAVLAEAVVTADPAGKVLAKAGRPGEATALATRASLDARRYRSLRDGFRVSYLQPLVNRNEASLSVVAQTLLGDYSADLTGGYNLNEARGFVRGTVTVARTWPWIELDLQQNERGYLALNLDSASEGRLQFQSFGFSERSYGMVLRAPLRQLTGAYQLALEPRFALRGLELFDFEGEVQNVLVDLHRVTGAAEVTASRLRQRVMKQILPREGQTISIKYQGVLEGFRGSQWQVSVGQLLPGFAPTHGIILRGHFRKESTRRQYQFADRFFYARGYEKVPSDATTTLSLDYHLPLWYPDFGFAGIVYVRRLRADVWGDYMQFRYQEPYAISRNGVGSVGVDLTLDAVFFNAQPIPVGVRFAYRLREDLFGVNTVGFAEPQFLLALPL